MKKFILIISLFSWVACRCHHKESKTATSIASYKTLSSFNKDTVNYIKSNFIEHKDEYVGKELKLLLDDLEIPIKRFGTSIGYPPYSYYSHISLEFYNYADRKKRIEMKMNPTIITITWETPIYPEAMDPIIKESKGIWTSKVREFFQHHKVKNIQIVDYGF